MAKGTRGSGAWIPAVLSIAILGLFAGWLYLRSNNQLKTQIGEAHGSFLLDSAHGPLLVVGDHVGAGHARRGSVANGDRIIVLDATTGAQLALRVFDDAVSCFPASAGRAWCELDTRLALVSIPELQTLAYVDDLVREAGLDMLVARTWRLDGAAAIVLLADGRAARIDPATLAVTSVSGEGTAGEPSRARCTTHAYRGAPSPELLDPELLDVHDPQLALVVHDSSRDPASRELQLSRVDPSAPRPRWTATLGSGSCELAATLGGLVIVTLANNGSVRALALDRETGAVRWKLAM